MSFESWLIFSSIAFIATVTPGPAILLVSTHSAAYGLKKAVITILGNVSGLLIMSALSVAGLSTILLYSTTIFIAIKFVGAAYLIYLGIKLWRFGFASKSEANTELTNNKAISITTLYVQGLFIALSNPKAITFTMAL
ncbi:MAG: LysE family translocator, partial [Cellvibrionaceae bacterium]